MLKYDYYSFSRLSCFQNCPAKFKFNYIDKIKIEQNNPALIKGSKIHDILEKINLKNFDYTNNEYYNIIKTFISSDLGQDILNKKSINELGIAFDYNMNPFCLDTFPSDKRILFKGFIDRVNKVENGIELIDYKTGNYKDYIYQDFSQLSYYALWFHKKFNFDQIQIRYVYVEHNKENSLILNNFNLIEKDLLKNIIEIEKCNNFNKKISKLCNWCEFKDICK